MKTRKPKVEDKIHIVKDCVFAIFKAFLDFNIREMQLYWMLLWEGLRGNCEVVEEVGNEQSSINT